MKGRKSYHFKALPHTEAFFEEYNACMRGVAAPKIEPGKDRIKPGTVTDLVQRYYHSPEFLGLADSTKQTYRNQLNRFCDKHGTKTVKNIQRKHIKALIAQMADRPGAANSLLARLKLLMKFALDIEMIKVNPLLGMSGLKTRTSGFHSWTESDIAKFEATHESGTKERLALALLLYTGQRRSDVVRMGWQHINDGYISVTQQKTGERLELPLHEDLCAELANTNKDNLTFLMTSFGKPYTSAGFGNWFRKQCDKAGLPHCTAHGLRKAAARRLAEAGCTNQQIKAVTGHRTEAEVNRYTRAASQKQLAAAAFAARSNKS
jgi:integrase